MKVLIVINLLILWYCSISAATKYRGKIYFEMISYENSASLRDNKMACDLMSIFKDLCDLVFRICLTSSNKKDGHKCDLLKLSTVGSVYHNTRRIKFGRFIGYIPNPIEIPMEYLPDSVHMSVNVTDYDVTREQLISQLNHAVQLYILERNASIESVNKILLNSLYSMLFVKIYGRCESGYYGNHCQVFCEPSNSAETGYYGCDLKTGHKYCLNGWIGKDCRQPDLCVTPENRCHGSSVCFMKGLKLRCSCPSTLKGKYCTEPIRPCKFPISGTVPKSPCLNNGICIAHGNGTLDTWKCQCPVGYRGEKCQYDVNECVHEDDNKTCSNGGKCINFYGGYRCNCTHGYWGKLCENPPVLSLISVYGCEDRASCAKANPLSNRMVICNISIKYEIFYSILVLMILVLIGSVTIVYMRFCRSRKTNGSEELPNVQYVNHHGSRESIYSECHYEEIGKSEKKTNSKPKQSNSNNDEIDDFNVYEEEESDLVDNTARNGEVIKSCVSVV